MLFDNSDLSEFRKGLKLLTVCYATQHEERDVYNASVISMRNDEPYMNRVHTLGGDRKSVRQIYQSEKYDEQR